MAGTSVLSLCEKGDTYIMEEIGKIFKKEKEMKKGWYLSAFPAARRYSSFFTLLIHCQSFAGIAFPTCVSVNNCVCHFSPVKSDPNVILKDGDLVKV